MHWIYWRNEPGWEREKKTDTSNPARMVTPLVSPSACWTFCNQILINKRSCKNPLDVSGIWCCCCLRRHVIKDSCLHSCLSFQDFRSYTGSIIVMKAGQYACTSCSSFGFVPRRLFSRIKTFFIYCFLDWSLMESGQEISVALHRTIWSQIPCTCTPLSLFLCPSLSLSFILHPSHLPPACQTFTIEPLSFTLVVPFLLLHAHIHLPPPPWYWSCPALNYFASVSD